MEIYWRDNFLCPEESEYKLMTIRKTGGLFMLAIRLMLLFSDNKKDFTRLTALLGERAFFMRNKFLLDIKVSHFNVNCFSALSGLYFQIRDDYCNLSLKEYSENKSFCEDLTEGKFSFPIIHAIQTQKDDKQEVLRKLHDEWRHLIR